MKDGAARYAIYFAPRPDSRWWQFGCRWLGRDPIAGCVLDQFELPPLTAEELQAITAAPRAYGFHATLKAPFALSADASPSDLYRSAAALARMQQPFAMGELILRSIGTFLALIPKRQTPQLRALAQICTEHFDSLRAPPAPAELARRRSTGLSPRQEELLARWGYPYVMDEWRFHMTLSRELSEAESMNLSAWLLPHVRQLNAEPIEIDAICVFEQPERSLPFRLTHRFGFDGRVNVYGRTSPRGRLFYVVGASGAGKDSLLAYAKKRLAGSTVAFAHRYITRSPDAGGENHVALGEMEFETRARRGAFAMTWSSNGHRYGIGAEIDHWLSNGLNVVVNGSREYLDVVRSRYPELTEIWVTASHATLGARLAARGRETGEAIEARLVRANCYLPPQGALVIDNDGPIASAGERLVRELSAAMNASFALESTA